uniref:Uncharacterized protein n=1 Tax=Tanacetum cinerariifolium TaxID=118510 RepID=A0A6L2NCY8_TANCI|nr:hypothetical protein [Tanacetum cinerariifolium]
MVTFEILDKLMEVVDSSRLNDRMRVWFVQALAEEEAFAGFLRDWCAGLRKSISKSQQLIAELEVLGECRDDMASLDLLRENVARDSAKLDGLEQMLAGAHVGIHPKEGYVAKVNEDD